MSNDKGIWLPAEIWALDMPPLHRVLLARVAALASGKEGCFAGDAYLAADLNCTPQHVRKMRKQLERQGYLVVTGYGHKRKMSIEVAPTGTSNHRNKQPEAQELQPQAQVLQPEAQLEATTGAHSIEYSKEKSKEPSKEKAKPKKEARPKSVEDVVTAFVDAGSTEDEAHKYFDYYESKGWKVGSAAMKDWKAAARNWLRNEKKYGPQNNWRDRSSRQLDTAKALEWANGKR